MAIRPNQDVRTWEGPEAGVGDWSYRGNDCPLVAQVYELAEARRCGDKPSEAQDRIVAHLANCVDCHRIYSAALSWEGTPRWITSLQNPTVVACGLRPTPFTVSTVDPPILSAAPSLHPLTPSPDREHFWFGARPTLVVEVTPGIGSDDPLTTLVMPAEMNPPEFLCRWHGQWVAVQIAVASEQESTAPLQQPCVDWQCQIELVGRNLVSSPARPTRIKEFLKARGPSLQLSLSTSPRN